jgi:hypothetical protein
MAVNTSGSISTYLSNIYEAALLTAREQSIMSKLITVFGDAQGMNGRAFSTYSGGTFGTIGEATDLTAQGFTPSTSGTLTPAIYAAAYQLSDMRVASDPFRVTADAGRDLGELYAVGVDTSLCGTAIFANLTAGTVGATVTALAWGTSILKAQALLRAQKAAGPYEVVLHPNQWYDLAASTSVPTLLQAQNLMDEFGQFYQASWAGLNFYVDANITNTSGTTNGGMFNRQAIALDIRRGFRIEPQRDASVGGGVTELNASAVYAYGLYRAAFGVLIKGASF